MVIERFNDVKKKEKGRRRVLFGIDYGVPMMETLGWHGFHGISMETSRTEHASFN